MGILNDKLNRIHHEMAKIAAKYFGEGETMPEFIDRQATINTVGLTTDAIKIDPIKTKYVDAQGNELVAVVRCKDCKHFSFWCELHETRVDPEEDYCSWAEGYKRCPFCGAKMDEVEDAD